MYCEGMNMIDNPLKNKKYNMIICTIVYLVGAFSTVIPIILLSITNDLRFGLLIIPCIAQLFFFTIPVVATLQD